jgi:integrase
LNVDQVTEEMAVEYGKLQRERGCRPRTIRALTQPMRSMYLGLVEKGIVTESPFHPKERALKRLVYPPLDSPRCFRASSGLVNAMFTGAEIVSTTSPREGARVAAAINIFAFSLGRNGCEVAQLHVGDYQRLPDGKGALRFKNGKGGTDEHVTIPNRAADAIEHWLSMRPASPLPHLLLWNAGKRVNEEGLRKLLRRACEAGGVPTDDKSARITPKVLRAWGATYMAKHGVSLPVISRKLRHKGRNALKTTLAYLYSTEEDEQNATEVFDSFGDFRKASPSGNADEPPPAKSSGLSGWRW